MTFMQIVFLVVALITLSSAVMVVSTKRMINAALWLVVTLFGVAILFAMLEVGFYTVVQVMVYIGAIAILIIFSLMLTRREREDTEEPVNKLWWLIGLISAGLFGSLVWVLSLWEGFSTILPAMPDGGQDIAAFGEALVAVDGFVLPFEVASVLLLGALIGAVFLGMERKGGRK